MMLSDCKDSDKDPGFVGFYERYDSKNEISECCDLCETLFCNDYLKKHNPCTNCKKNKIKQKKAKFDVPETIKLPTTLDISQFPQDNDHPYELLNCNEEIFERSKSKLQLRSLQKIQQIM